MRGSGIEGVRPNTRVRSAARRPRRVRGRALPDPDPRLIHLVWDVIPDEFGWSQPSWWYVSSYPDWRGCSLRPPFDCRATAVTPRCEGLGADPIPPIVLASILPAALASLGLGLGLGPEAPLIALGLGLGAVAVRLIRLEGTGAQLLALAGAFAAVAALFGGPLIAAFLLFEVTAAGGKIPAQQIGRALLPGFVAAGTGASSLRGLRGGTGCTRRTSRSLRSRRTSVRITDLAWCLFIAAVVAAVVVAIRHLAIPVAAQSDPRPAALLDRCGLAVGVLAVVFRAIHRPAGRPRPVLGSVRAAGCHRRGIAGVLISSCSPKVSPTRCRWRWVPRWPVFPAIASASPPRWSPPTSPRLDTTPAVAAGIAAGTTAVLRVPFTAVLLVIAPHGRVGLRRRSDRGPRGCDRLARRHDAPESRGPRAAKAVEAVPASAAELPPPLWRCAVFRALLRLGFQLVADAVARMDEGVPRARRSTFSRSLRTKTSTVRSRWVARRPQTRWRSSSRVSTRPCSRASV